MNEKCGKLLIKYIIDTGHTNRVENKHPHLTHAKQAEDHSGRNQGRIGTQCIHNHCRLAGTGARQKQQKKQQ